jgi:uncharacterized protein
LNSDTYLESAAELHQAVAKNDQERVDAILKKGCDIDRKHPDSGLTPLMVACGYGYLELAQRLLRLGADPNCADHLGGAFPIHKACQGGHLPLVKLLLDHGALIDCQSSATGHTPLMEAIWFKFTDIVEYLLQQNACLSIPTHYGFSLEEHVSYELKVNKKPAEREKIKAIQSALQRRQANDLSLIKDNQLMDAVINNDLDTLATLLDQGFPVDKRCPRLGNFNDGHTPLLVAIRDGHYEAARQLLAGGADPNAIEPTFLAVPLHKATYNGRVDMTQLLLQHPDINIDYQGPTNGYTPLHDALWHGFDNCAKLLIDAGANLKLRGHDGKLPIDLAIDVFGEDSDMVSYLQQRLANPIST